MLKHHHYKLELNLWENLPVITAIMCTNYFLLFFNHYFYFSFKKLYLRFEFMKFIYKK